jgi:hypothetical protein
MSTKQQHGHDDRPYESMQRAMGRGAQDDVIRQALARIDGAPAPEMDLMQAAMGPESQIRAVYQVIREYLDERNLPNTDAWARKS